MFRFVISEVTGKLICPEKMMILRWFLSASICCHVSPEEVEPEGSVDESEEKPPKKGIFAGRMSFAIASSVLFCVFGLSSLESSIVFFGPHRLTAFAHADYLKRTREGGSSQKGTIVGFGADYERLKEFGIYLFGETSEGKGTLKGSTSGEAVLKSRFYQENYFGRLGWSISFCKFIFAPFVGGGYTQMTNRFVDPSPLLVSMKIHYPYMLWGLKLEWQKSDKIHFITSLQLEKPFEPKCTIDDDPEYFTTHQTIKEKIQTVFQIGARFQQIICLPFDLSGETYFFYQHNQYGRHDNFPFNFLDTTHNVVGLRASVSVLF